MADKCRRCGGKLSFMERLSGAASCSKCREEEKRLREQAKARYPAVLRDIWHGKIPEDEGKRTLEMLSLQAGLHEGEQGALHSEAFREFAAEVLADDVLTETEENRLLLIAENLLGITQEKLECDFRDILFRLFVARVNDGRLPTMTTQKLILKKNEEAHLEMSAALLKEVAITEYQGGYSGFSFRIVKGVRYHVGGVRGRRVVVGMELKEEDKGVIIVTSHRIVFLGSRKTIEMPYNKLLSLEVFEDGVRFHLSNRKTAPLFKVESAHPIAAIVNAATQHLRVG